MRVCNCSMFCCTLLDVPSSFAIILMGKREQVALLSLSSWCLVIVVWLFFTVPVEEVIDKRGEVALMSRNIVIHGEMTDK